MFKDLIVIGAGGHSKVVIESILTSTDYRIIGLIDQKEKVGQTVLSIPIIGTDSDLEQYYQNGIKNAVIAIGSIGNPHLRIKCYHRLKHIGYAFPNIIDKGALITNYKTLGEGNYIAKGAMINANTCIGNMCIINTGAIIEHDCNLGNFVHIAPHATVCGSVKIADKSHIGCSATIIQGMTVGHDSIIGAGSVVVHDVPSQVTVYGVPAK